MVRDFANDRIMTDKEIIEKLGDTREVAARIERPLAQVSLWKRRGIPYRYRAAVALLACEKNMPLRADFLLARRA